MKIELTGPHRTTYDAVFQHPVSHNLKWVDLRAMLVSLSDNVQEDGELLKITRHGHYLTLHRPKHGGMDDVAELMKVRHFLTQSDAPASAPRQTADGTHLLVVIDHRLASIYRTELHGSVPQRIIPYDPFGTGRHLHSIEDKPTGRRKPEEKSYYESIAKSLQGADAILLFGSGTGASSAMEALVADLQKNHADLAKRVIGSLVVNEQHLTEDQLLAKAREFYAGVAT